MGTHRQPIGVTARGDWPDGSMRHAATRARASQWGYNERAVCGTSIRPAGAWMNRPWDGQVFTGTHPRDCPRCARAIGAR